MAVNPLRRIFGRTARGSSARLPLAGERRESVQRLQVGLFGLGAMILLVGLASIIMRGVAETEATTVPEAAPTMVASETPSPARDPLADAGVVPDLPAEPAPTDTPTAQGTQPEIIIPPAIGNAQRQ